MKVVVVENGGASGAKLAQRLRGEGLDVEVIHDERDILVCALADAADKSDRLEQCQAALESANQERHELLSLVAHELRNPLQSMLLRAQLAANGDPRAVANLPQSVEKQVTAMVRLISDLLDSARVDDDGVDKQRISLGDVVRDAVERVASGNDHRLLTDVAEVLEVDADPERIAQIVSKYLETAIAQAPKESCIDIAIERRDGVARVSVTGSGMVDNERQPDMRIGLYLCRRLAELHSGRAGADRVPGRGTTFWLELPLASRSQRPIATSGNT